jgi:hypothetical protein
MYQSENHAEISIEKEMKKSYLDYAMSVIKIVSGLRHERHHRPGFAGRPRWTQAGPPPGSLRHARAKKRLEQTVQKIGPHRR